MNKNLVLENLLYSNKITEENIFSIINLLWNKNLDYSDIYIQCINKEIIELKNNSLTNRLHIFDQGIGIRSLYNDQIKFSFTNKINNNSLLSCAKQILNITKNSKKTKNIIKKIKRKNYKNSYILNNFLTSISETEKTNFLKEINQKIRNKDKRVKEVKITLSGKYENILIISTDNVFKTDIRPSVILFIDVLIEQNGKLEYSKVNIGGKYDYSYFFKKYEKRKKIEHYIEKIIKLAVTNLLAKPAPVGNMPVILGPGCPGILIHEAIGHGLEGDFNRKNISIYSKKIGKKVASKLCTIIDNSKISKKGGSLLIDDEGTVGKSNTLIKCGILQKYMQDKLNAKLMHTKSTGNARRETYSYPPIPRMTNTYMIPGKSTIEEMISSIDYGIYAINFSGGQVDITSGKFVFSTSEAYLIKNGKIVYPIKGAALIGSGEKVMKEILMVGNDLKIDSGVGICGKNGQNVPVSVGQPSIKIKSLIIGGTSKT